MITFPPINRITIWFAIVLFTAISFSWSERLNSIGIILLVIHWLADPQLIKKVKSFRFDLLSGLLFAFIGFQLIGLFFSDDLHEGWQSIEVKLSCIILPILFSTEHYLTDKRRNQLLLLFSSSCLLAFIYSASMSYFHHIQLGWNAVLNRMSISEAIMHPGYFSNYFCLAFIWCVYELIEQRRLSKLMKLILLVFILLLGISILFLASKTAIIFIGCFMVYLIWRLLYRITNLPIRILSFLVLLSGFLLVSIQVPTIRNRITEFNHDSKVIDKNTPLGNSTASRMVAWKSEWTLIKEHWLLGYGTGDANTILQTELHQEGYHQLASDHMHTHMQLMHTWLDVGIFGPIFLLLILGFAAFSFLQRKRWLGAWFILLIFLNTLTDDMFEIQAGIVFFMFTMLLLYFQKEEQKYYGPSYW